MGLIEGPDFWTPMWLPIAQIPTEFLADSTMRVECQIIVRLAGAFTEARFLHMYPGVSLIFGGGKEDWEFAQECAAGFYSSKGERNHFFEEMEKRTRLIMRRNWLAVVALAEALLAKRRIEWQEALAIFHAAMGKTG
jgi:hypothetical protein